MVGGKARNPAPERAHFPAAYGLHHLAGIDLHRAGDGAQAVARAGVDGLILVEFAQGAPGRAIATDRLEARQFTETDDALARCQRQRPRRAPGLAEAALDALVDQRVDRRHRLEVPEVDMRIIVEDDPGVEDVVGIEDFLDPLHQPIGVRAPFQLDVGRDIAPGAVLGLERAVVLVDDHVAELVHEPPVAIDLRRLAEILGEHEVEVALQGMAENDRLVVAVLAEQRLQVDGGVGELGDVERHVLDDHGGSRVAHGADGRKQPLADLPELGVLLRHVGKTDGKQRLDIGKRGADGGDLLGEPFTVAAAGLDQQGGRGPGESFQEIGHAGLGLDRAQRRPVHQFDRGDGGCLEHGDGPASGVDIGKEDEGARLVAVFFDRAQGDLGDEAEGSLGSDHQVLKDLERVLEIDERVEAVPGGVLDPELLPDPVGEGFVVAGAAGQRVEIVEELAMSGGERLAAFRIAGIDDAAVGQHDAHALQCLVTVLGGSAAHAAGIVGGDAADLGGVDRRGIGADLAVVGGQARIGVATDNAGLEGYLRPLGADRMATPPGSQPDQDRVGNRLTGQRGAGGSEGHRCPRFSRQAQGPHDLDLVDDLDDQLRDQPVEAGIGSVGQGPQGIADQPGLGNERTQFAVHLIVWMRKRREGHGYEYLAAIAYGYGRTLMLGISGFETDNTDS